MDENIKSVYTELMENNKQKNVILIAHLGGFKEKENNYRKYVDNKSQDIYKEVFYKNHLGRLGLVSINEVVKPSLCLVSEFGEELKGNRIKFADILNDMFKKEVYFIPADIGLKINVNNMKVKAITEIDVDKLFITSENYGYVKYNQVQCCTLRTDYSLHYYHNTGSKKYSESDLIQSLIETFGRRR